MDEIFNFFKSFIRIPGNWNTLMTRMTRMTDMTRMIPVVGLVFLTAGGLTGCSNSRDHTQPIASVQNQSSSMNSNTNSNTNPNTSSNIHFKNTAAHSGSTTVLQTVTYGPPMPSPAILAAIQSNHDLQPAPQEIPILMYHSISDRPNNTLVVSPDHFALEMKHLYDAGYHTIGFDDLKNAWLNHKPLPKKPVIITFDDGYANNYQAAYPVLKRYNLRATIFVVTGHVGDPSALTWNQIRFMDQQGLVQFGDHTVDHLDLSRLSRVQQQYEIQQSKTELERQLRHPITTFCYPSGRYNATTLQLLQQAGFQFAVTTHPGYAALKQGQLTLRRVRVSGDESVATFSYAFS